MNHIERRFTPSAVDARAARFLGKQHQIGGHAAKFNVRSENFLAGTGLEFYEIIEPGFFDNVLGNDVRALFNHDSNLILGRTASRTCRIAQDTTGLAYEVDLDEGQSYARDLLISIERGDVSQSSFAFTVKRGGKRYVEQGDVILCYLIKGACERLYDVSPVTLPAYPDATVSLREAEQALGRRLLSTDAATAARNRQLQLMEAESGESPGSDAARRARELQLAEVAQ
jgi:HK97 family phage prohead protease